MQGQATPDPTLVPTQREFSQNLQIYRRLRNFASPHLQARHPHNTAKMVSRDSQLFDGLHRTPTSDLFSAIDGFVYGSRDDCFR